MHFDTALNLLWLVLGAFALASTLRSRLRGASRQKVQCAGRAPVWLQVCGVALIVATLFPYISATDDVLRIEHMNVEQTSNHHQQTGKKSGIDGLIRLYETMDTPVICTVREISFILFFVAMVLIPVRRGMDRTMPQRSGRSPPFCLA